jgi:hypothetical protein
MGDAIIPSDWEGEYCKFAVCWPNSPRWLAVLRGVLTIPASGRFWNEQTGTITEAQEVICETFDYNFRNEGVIMACGDSGLADIASALLALAQAQQNMVNATLRTSGGCCDPRGSLGAGTMPETINSESPGDPGNDPPPEGFESWEEFFANLCARANDFLVRLENSVDDWRNLVFADVTGAILAVAAALLLSVTVPFIDVFAAILILLGVEAQQVLGYILSILNDNHAALLCAIYTGATPAESRANLLTVFNGFVDEGGFSAINGFAVKNVFSSLVSPDEFNHLADKSLVQTYAEADCSSCSPDCYTWDFASTLDGWETAEGYRTVSQDSEDEGTMKLDGIGGGGPNFSIAVISADDFAAKFGLTPDDFNIGQISGTISFKTVNPSYPTTFIFRIWSTVTDHDIDLSGIFTTGTTGEITVGASEEVLDRIEILAGNSGVGSSESFVAFVHQIDLCINP